MANGTVSSSRPWRHAGRVCHHAAMIGRLHHVIMDCPDPMALATFYSELLGLPVTYQSDDFVVVAANDTSSGLAFQLAPGHQPPTWPDPASSQQVHLDVMVEDVAAAGPRVLALGAVRLDGDVFADPAGHTFCLIRRRSWRGLRCQSLAILTCRSRKTLVPSRASIWRRARLPTSLSRAPPAPMTMAFWLGRSTYSSACTSTRSSRPGRGPISSTTTAIECGSSSRTPSSAASLISSATMICSGSSVSSPSGYRGTPSGRWETSTSASTSRLYPVTAETGTTSAQSPRALAATSCSAI